MPLALEGELNRTKAELAEARGDGELTPFTAEKTYQAGSIIVRGGKVLTASQIIVTGETVRPGVNCTETTMETVINTLQEDK